MGILIDDDYTKKLMTHRLVKSLKEYIKLILHQKIATIIEVMGIRNVPSDFQSESKKPASPANADSLNPSISIFVTPEATEYSYSRQGRHSGDRVSSKPRVLQYLTTMLVTDTR